MEEFVDVVGVCFKKGGRKYYFDSNNLPLKNKLTVIVETERGLQFGYIVTNIIHKEKKNIIFPLKKVIRISTKKDYTQYLNNIKDAENAKKKCIELVTKYNLDMKIIDANYTFERTQLCFNFTSTGRVDFRELTKRLASIYKVRIELRQIGPRDKAKEVGGLGPCGMPLCCSKYLYSFNNITINMAKKQNIALNPSKINGVCNRLLCCLSYEEDTYDKLLKEMPKIGEYIEIDKNKGKVIFVDSISNKFKIETDNHIILEFDNNGRN